jgi:hypothetical protein
VEKTSFEKRFGKLKAAAEKKGEDLHRFEILPPASNEEITILEKSLGSPMPSSCKSFLQSVCGGICAVFDWVTPREFNRYSFGLADWNLRTIQSATILRDSLVEAWEITEDSITEWKLLLTSLPFVTTPGGNYLAFDTRKESWPIIYFDHTMMGDEHGRELGPDLSTFMEEWLNLGLIDPEVLVWLITNPALAGDREAWRKWVWS